MESTLFPVLLANGNDALALGINVLVTLAVGGTLLWLIMDLRNRLTSLTEKLEQIEGRLEKS